MWVAVVGSRNCKNYVLEEVIQRIPSAAKGVISGGAQGIDQLAEQAARARKIPCIKILPDYKKYGKHAPLVRNREIVRATDLVLAFWDYSSRGTASVIAYCIEEGVPVEIIGIE